jgi:hypothetical protein
VQELQLVQPELEGMHCCLSVAGNQRCLVLGGPSQSWLQVAGNDLQGSNPDLELGKSCGMASFSVTRKIHAM